MAALERGLHDPSTEVLARVAAVLGMDLAIRLYPGTGPLIRDHHQAAMIEALLGIIHPRWRPVPEVWVTHPVKGVIDLVLEPDGRTEPLVAVEAQSELRRLEQQVRWAHAKSAALSEARGRPVSSLLLLRSTRSTRAVAAEHEATMRAAYPAATADCLAALTGTADWPGMADRPSTADRAGTGAGGRPGTAPSPGAAVLWCDVSAGRARIRARPPRTITVGR